MGAAIFCLSGNRISWLPSPRRRHHISRHPLESQVSSQSPFVLANTIPSVDECHCFSEWNLLCRKRNANPADVLPRIRLWGFWRARSAKRWGSARAIACDFRHPRRKWTGAVIGLGFLDEPTRFLLPGSPRRGRRGPHARARVLPFRASPLPRIASKNLIVVTTA